MSRTLHRRHIPHDKDVIVISSPTPSKRSRAIESEEDKENSPRPPFVKASPLEKRHLSSDLDDDNNEHDQGHLFSPVQSPLTKSPSKKPRPPQALPTFTPRHCLNTSKAAATPHNVQQVEQKTPCSPNSPSPKRPCQSPTAAHPLPHVVLSPYSQGKLDEFKRVLVKNRDVWFSWEEKGKTKTFGLKEESSEEGVILLPKVLEGNRDKMIKPKFMEIVALIDRSPLKRDLQHILRETGIFYPVRSSQLKQTSGMKIAYKEIRALLQAKGVCEVLGDGVLRTSATLLGVVV